MCYPHETLIHCTFSLILVAATLHLYSNRLSGTIPSTLGDLNAAQKIIMHFNQLVGSMPEEVCALTEQGGELEQLVVSCGLSSGPDCDCCIDCIDL